MTIEIFANIVKSDGTNQTTVYTANDKGKSTNDDIIQAVGAAANVINAGAGNDVVYGNKTQENTIDAGDGNDYVYGGAKNDFINAGSGSDTVLAGDGNDTVWGGIGHDWLFGGSGDDTLFGDNGAGSGTMAIASLKDLVDMGATKIRIDNAAGNFAGYAELNSDGTVSQFRMNWGALRGETIDSAKIDSSNIARYFDAYFEKNFVGKVAGNGGNDVLNGGTGDDTLNGGVGDDVFQYTLNQAQKALNFEKLWGNDTIQDFNQNGYYLSTYQGKLFDEHDKLDLRDLFARMSDADVDTLLSSISDLVTMDTSGKYIGQYRYNGIDDANHKNVDTADVPVMSNGRPLLVNRKPVFTGDGVFDNQYGHDTTYALTHPDDNVGYVDGALYRVNSLSGDTYEFTISAQHNESTHLTNFVLKIRNLNDASDHGATITLDDVKDLNANDFMRETMKLVHGADDATNGDNLDFSAGVLKEALGDKGVIAYGFKGNDTITGTDKADELRGGDGVDTLHGGNGDDQVVGDAGNDRLFGDAGNDSLWGGTGGDRLEGGAGNDFLYGGSADVNGVHNTLVGDWEARDASSHAGEVRGDDVFVIGGKVSFDLKGGPAVFNMDAGVTDILDFTNTGYDRSGKAIGAEHDKIKFGDYFPNYNLADALVKQQFVSTWFANSVHVDGSNVDISTSSTSIVHIQQADHDAAQALFNAMQAAVNSGKADQYFLFG